MKRLTTAAITAALLLAPSAALADARLTTEWTEPTNPTLWVGDVDHSIFELYPLWAEPTED